MSFVRSVCDLAQGYGEPPELRCTMNEMEPNSQLGAIDRTMGSVATFTVKQREVLDLVLRHKSSKEIARALNISPYTVDQRITAARQKLGLSSRGELARAYSKMRGLCDETAYGFSHIDMPTVPTHLLTRDQPVDPVFMLSDSTSLEMGLPWDGEPVQPAGLEAFDNRFGILGRILVIPAFAALITLLALSVAAIAMILPSIL